MKIKIESYLFYSIAHGSVPFQNETFSEESFPTGRVFLRERGPIRKIYPTTPVSLVASPKETVSIIIYSTIIYPTIPPLQYLSTILYPTMLHPTIIYSTILYPTILYPTLLCNTKNE